MDNEQIVVIATYSDRNTKTGKVVQTYILRENINPLEASKTGADFSICGNCIMRGTPTDDPKRKIAKGRRCYVNLGQGVLIVYKVIQARCLSDWRRGRNGTRSIRKSRDVWRPRCCSKICLGQFT